MATLDLVYSKTLDADCIVLATHGTLVKVHVCVTGEEVFVDWDDLVVLYEGV